MYPDPSIDFLDELELLFPDTSLPCPADRLVLLLAILVLLLFRPSLIKKIDHFEIIDFWWFIKAQNKNTQSKMELYILHQMKSTELREISG